MKLTSNQSLFIHLVRGLSALAVMGGHSLSALASEPDLSWYKVQSSAVVVFFVLSGFLICFSAARKEEYSFGEYFIDRFARIYVAFVPALALTYLLDIFSGSLGSRHSMDSLLANLLMFQGIPFDRLMEGWPSYRGYGTNSPLWTVAVEWWLYMGFGVIFFSSRLRGLGLVAAAVLVLPILSVIALYSFRENLGTIWIISALLAVPIALLPSEKASRFAWAALALSLAMLVYKVLVLRQRAQFSPYDAQLMFAMAFSVLCAVAALKSIKTPFMEYAAKPITWLSDISYSLYLIHYPILIAFLALLPEKLTITTFLVYNAVGILAAWLFTLAFDRHHASVAKWLKRQFLTLPAQAPATTR